MCVDSDGRLRVFFASFSYSMPRASADAAAIE